VVKTLCYQSIFTQLIQPNKGYFTQYYSFVTDVSIEHTGLSSYCKLPDLVTEAFERFLDFRVFCGFFFLLGSSLSVGYSGRLAYAA